MHLVLADSSVGTMTTHPVRRVDDRGGQAGPQPPALGEHRPPGGQRPQVIEYPFEALREAGQRLGAHLLLGAQLGDQMSGHDLDRERPLGTERHFPRCLCRVAVCAVDQLKRLEPGLIKARADDPVRGISNRS